MKYTSETMRRRTVAIVAAAVIGSVALLTACGGGSELADETPTSARPTKTASATVSTPAPTGTATQAVPTSTAPVAEPTSTAVPPPPPDQPTAPPPAPTAPSVPPTAPPPAGVSITINGVGSVFSPSSGATRVGAPTTITFNNQDVDVTHDFVLFNPSGGQVAATELAAGPIVQTVNFTPTVAGGYSFKCSVHPQQMRGVITVQ